MSQLNTGFDTDIDSFLNLDNEYTPVSATATPHPAVPALAHQPSSNFGVNSSQQTFAGPSFQYEQYRQQTGLPVGGLANTFAVNQTSGLQHFDGQGGFVMPNEISTFPLTKIDDFDFARHSSFDMTDVDFEDDSPTDLPAMYYPGGSSKAFVSPTNLISSNASPSTSTPIQRIYPGMHSQQAAQKAQEKQQELIRQQQQQQQQQQPPRQVPGQKPLPKSQLVKDPAVEESISRILSQMRQKSVATSEEDGTPVPSISNMPRMKKEDDDMDEDERLLASEEGKKLSSKERRQLRNKVSARAFRSRRKGKSNLLAESGLVLT
jgi:bZIP-type transcription factor MBZ1